MRFKITVSAVLLSILTLASCQSENGASNATPGAITLSESLTITDEGTYTLTGTLEDGRITVDADKNAKIEIILDGVDITSKKGAPIYIKEADKVTLTLADGSTNTLTNTDGYASIDDNNIDAVIFSKADLDIEGSGELHVNANVGNGITSKDDLTLDNCNITVQAGNHALEANDLVSVSGCTLDLVAAKDAIHSENEDDETLGNIEIISTSIKATAVGDGIDASGYIMIDNCSTDINAKEKGIVAAGNLTLTECSLTITATDDTLHSNSNVLINGGVYTLESEDDGIHADKNVRINSGDITVTNAYEGIEGQTVDIVGSNIYLNTSDDGINAAGGNDQSGFGGGRDMFAVDENAYVTISGGKTVINADGDGIDSNGRLTVTGGELYVWGPTSGANGSLDYASEAIVEGGIVVALGSVGMSQNFGNNSTQCSFMINFNGNAEEELTISDANGNVIISFTPEKKYSSVLVSHPDFALNETYTVTSGENTQTVEFTSNIVGGGFGGFGDFGGGGFRGGRGERPSGGWETNEDGTMPEMPEMPENGEMPTPPDMGEWPEMPEGGFDFEGSFPEGMTPPDFENMPGMPQKPNDETTSEETDSTV
ncbi:MAG: carbohydrate-binding domain-containing protein [Clostridia bacterium]|nr:carbohydrate-binding domain-containing protein [Clostridia bacterium]